MREQLAREPTLATRGPGERLGPSWLDVTRYADSTGTMTSIAIPYSRRHRNYAIDYPNRDLPFDQFVRQQQLAWDLLPSPDDDQPPHRPDHPRNSRWPV